MLRILTRQMHNTTRLTSVARCVSKIGIGRSNFLPQQNDSAFQRLQGSRSMATIWGTTHAHKYTLQEFSRVAELEDHENITLFLSGEPINQSPLFVSIEDIVRDIFAMKGDDVVVIQVDEQRRDVADFFVVVSGKSARHLRAMASSLATMCNEKLDLKSGRVRVEGLGDHFWTVVHTGNTLVHFMLPAARAYYRLEELWMPESNDTGSPAQK